MDDGDEASLSLDGVWAGRWTGGIDKGGLRLIQRLLVFRSYNGFR
jgi:hypothetical protein